MGGTYYRSPAPGEPPFVREGDKVEKGQTVAIIEAMKLMNEIEVPPDMLLCSPAIAVKHGDCSCLDCAADMLVS